MTDFTAPVIALSTGIILGTILTARFCAWWYGRKMTRVESTAKRKMAAKLAAL